MVHCPWIPLTSLGLRCAVYHGGTAGLSFKGVVYHWDVKLKAWAASVLMPLGGDLPGVQDADLIVGLDGAEAMGDGNNLSFGYHLGLMPWRHSSAKRQDVCRTTPWGGARAVLVAVLEALSTLSACCIFCSVWESRAEVASSSTSSAKESPLFFFCGLSRQHTKCPKRDIDV